MRVLYRGFDGLDVSFRAQISGHLADELEQAKEWAQKTRQDACMTFAGMKLLIAETGARGGYSYRASTGQMGATWFFKKPNPSDPWGVRISCGSFMLAERGLGGARADMYRTMERLGVTIQAQAESIGRVDYAIDIFAPDFTLEPENFVMHSNATRADHFDQNEATVHGKSGRVTSVTIGKMPGRQVIVYDKRAEVIAHHKWAWFDIWNANLSCFTLPAIDFAHPDNSRVWRIELRAGKSQLKDGWNIRTWRDLDERLGDLFHSATEAIRYAEPSSDCNRSRWPDSLLWETVRNELDEDLFEMRNFAPPDTIKRVQREAHARLLEGQSMGLVITRAAIKGVPIESLAREALIEGQRMANEISKDQCRYGAKLRERADRYEILL